MTDHLYRSLLLHLAEPAARAALLASFAGLAMALFRAKDVALRLALWTGVLYAALSMPFIGWLAPSLPLPLPRPLGAGPARMISRTPVETLSKSRLRSGVGVTSPRDLHPAASRAHPDSLSPWPRIAAGTYFLGAALLLIRLAIGLALGGRLRRSAGPIADPRALGLLSELRKGARLKHLPALAESKLIAVPLTLGFIRPLILLPAAWSEWDERKLRAVLAHELSHVARKDHLTLLFSSIHRCFFWFSPLSWWLDRKLAELAEQASDDSAVKALADRAYYAEILLGFLETLRAASGRVRWQGAAMALSARADRRLERILNAPAWSKGIRKPAGAVLLVMAAPVLYFAAAARPALRSQAPLPAPAKPLAGICNPGPAPRPPAVAPGEPGPPCGGIVEPEIVSALPPMAGVIVPPAIGLARAPEVAPVAPVAPVVGVSPCVGVVAPALPGPPAFMVALPVPPEQAKAPKPPSEEPGAIVISQDDEGEDYVIVSGDRRTVSGSSDDPHVARALGMKISGDYIWFRRDGKEYIIRDKATVEQAKTLFFPQQELGRKQEALGKMLEELGAQQEELGKQMEAVRVKLPDVRKELKKLQAELADIDSFKTQEELGRIEAELGEMQSRIAEAQGQAGEMQGKLGAQQGELGQKQGELGREQGELGREQGRLLREGSRKMKDLLDDALAHKTAEPASK